ncbi:DUF5979 domain-containing protein [Oerskovia sp. Root22]|uniref:DUF5979 domain-containing protein n=1 Tax=Oerskovia sp. Root22 TaxID=1736494 RepID=UPI0006FF67AF|nr:DUF5979 domain-containing protein [Oerskovia sp. Root22]KRC32966.1 hypothetical protein ASE15_14720 [Oerskovia sp. Root22]
MSTPFRVRSRAASPLQRTVAAATSALLALTGAVALGAGPLAAPAAAQLPMCPAPGEMPGIGNTPEFTDSNIAVYAGGNYSATGTAAESEGLLVVMGDALFDKAGGGTYNVGSAGVGSQITPPGGTTMLAVGGNLVVGPVTNMDVGAQVAGGGNVDVGGTITNTIPIALNGGTATAGMGAAAVAPYTDFQDVITEQSQILAAPAGTPGAIESWGEVRFTGDPASTLHTFTLDGTQLSSLDRKFSVYLDGVGGTAPIVINVTGPVVDFDTQSVFLNGTQVNALSSAEFGNAASRILWNFVDATLLELGENDQFMGSILAPLADTTLKTSTNGRVYVGGDLAVLGTGGGIEQHNYPWIGPGPFACRDASGATFSVAKSVTGSGADAVPAGTTFEVDYSYVLDGTTITGTLDVLADGTAVTGPQGLPEGTVVTLSEPRLPTVPGVEWGTPTFEPSSPVTLGAGGTVAVRLTNTANLVDAPAGGFSVAKELLGSAAGQVPEGTEFTVAYAYELDGQTQRGTLTVLADGTFVDGPQNLPVGTVVTFTEIDLPDVAGVVWGAPTFSPESVTISDGVDAQVTVTNTAAPVVVRVGGFSLQKAVTGEAADLVPGGTEFTVAYSYELAGAPVTGTLVVTADGTVVNGPQNLPAGTVVSFDEVSLPDIDGVVWGAPVFSPDTLTVAADENPTIVLANTATDAPAGGFSVQKLVTGEASGLVPGGTEFTVSYSYALDGVPTSGTLSVLADGTVVDGPQNLPVGTVVTFAEVSLPAIDGVVWGAPTFSPATVTIVDDVNAEVTVTNTATDVPAGGFSLRKTVTGTASGLVPAGTEFTVTYSYQLDGVPTSGTATVLADGTLVNGPQNLPVGTEVTFGEINLPTIDGVVWGAPAFSPATVTIADDVDAQVTVTNTADAVVVPVGGFSLRKVVEGAASGLVPAGTEFTVEYSYEIDGATTGGRLTVLADGTVVNGPQNLVAGTVVTFAEVALPEIPGVVWGAPVFSPESVTIGDSTSPEVTLTNRADLTVGGFSLQKVVTGEAADLVPEGTEFTVTYGYELDGVPTSGTLSVLADGTVVNGPQNLPFGTVVTFDELDLPSIDGVVWGAPVFSPETLAIGDGSNPTVTLTNTATDAPAGGFSLQKAVTGEASGLVPGGTEFTVSYSYELGGVPTSSTLTVLADGTVVNGPQNLPVGTVVTFEEIDLPSIDGVVWGAPAFSPASVTIEDDVTTEVTVTNTATDEPAGGFSLRKVVEGAASGAVPAGTEFTVTYSYELDGVPTSGTSTVLADGTLVDGPQNLPVGTVVTFGEVDLPELSGVVWGAPAFSPATVTVADGTSAVVTVTNTADVVAAQVGSFSILKKIEGPNAAKVPTDTEFTVTFAGTVNGEHQEGTLTVRADGTVVDGPANLPAGTVVELEETSLPKIDGVSWGTPAFTVDGEKVSSITIGAGQVVEVTLTNTAGSGLAVTGTGALGIAAAALLLLGGGAVLLVGARRRRA